jgi:isoquinoline 1-oxidoreductase subunit beta
MPQIKSNGALRNELDCGLVVNPDRVRAQFEGAVIMGTGNALYCNIGVKQGQVELSNFGNYLAAGTDIAPETHVRIVESSAPPGGVGEPGVPSIAQRSVARSLPQLKVEIRALPIDPAQLNAT